VASPEAMTGWLLLKRRFYANYYFGQPTTLSLARPIDGRDHIKAMIYQMFHRLKVRAADVIIIAPGFNPG
jgi:hypothetical protein